MQERIYQHVVTKGGESYTLELGVFECEGYGTFDSYRYLCDRIQYEAAMLKVDDDAYIALDCIARISFTRKEVH